MDRSIVTLNSFQGPLLPRAEAAYRGEASPVVNQSSQMGKPKGDAETSSE